MRLIDADKLTEGRVENDLVAIAANCTPTAFDMEKATEKLEASETDRSYPMMVRCKMSRNSHGLAYGKEASFCGGLLVIRENDVKKMQWRKIDHMTHKKINGTDYGVLCPECGSFVLLNKSKLSKYIKASAGEALVVPPQQYE